MDNTPEINAERTEETAADRRLAWGIAPPDGTVAAWGARAIYTENRTSHDDRYTKRGTRRKVPKAPAFSIELLWDRQAGAGRNAELQLLQTWINERGLPWLRKECSDRFITRDCDETVTMTEGDFTITASPRESCGYLYIGAWYAPSKVG